MTGTTGNAATSIPATAARRRDLTGIDFVKTVIVLKFNCEAGVRFDNSFFDKCFDLVRQLKNRSF